MLRNQGQLNHGETFHGNSYEDIERIKTSERESGDGQLNEAREISKVTNVTNNAQNPTQHRIKAGSTGKGPFTSQTYMKEINIEEGNLFILPTYIYLGSEIRIAVYKYIL